MRSYLALLLTITIVACRPGQKIDAAGGTITLPGTAVLRFPSRAFAQATRVHVNVAPKAQPGQSQITIDTGMDFPVAPIGLDVPIPVKGKVPAVLVTISAHGREGKWVALPTIYDRQTRTLHALIPWQAFSTPKGPKPHFQATVRVTTT